MPEICPDCDIEMKEEDFCGEFGNPIPIKTAVPTEVCPKCGFRIVSEEHLGTIKRAIPLHPGKC
ncbi:MAG: hypothetical protein JXC85_01125 [Candidatus Aenigmarchaeota archaeon]|nr:hypothetical protein [Candidatus Aenigmarchaeota archaeon]